MDETLEEAPDPDDTLFPLINSEWRCTVRELVADINRDASESGRGVDA
jgi:hypothetical protein